jgi:hypothetical protein
MAHPFERMFEKALQKSKGDENHVLGEAEKLLEKGYAPKEIYAVLQKLQQGLLIESDEKIVTEAVEAFGIHVDTGHEDSPSDGD